MRIGLDAYTIHHRGLDVEQTLAFARELGLEGVQFLEPSTVAPDLDPSHLAEVRSLADSQGLALEVGLPSPNPIRQSRIEGRSVDPAEHASRLIKHIAAVSHLGCPHARVYLGDRHDRFRTGISWNDQLSASREVIQRLTPALRDHGIALAVENHADATLDELLTILHAFDPDLVLNQASPQAL